MSLITLYHLNKSLPKRSSLAVQAVGIIARFGGLLSFMKYLLILVLFFSCNERKAHKTGEIGIIKEREVMIRLVDSLPSLITLPPYLKSAQSIKEFDSLLTERIKNYQNGIARRDREIKIWTEMYNSRWGLSEKMFRYIQMGLFKDYEQLGYSKPQMITSYTTTRDSVYRDLNITPVLGFIKLGAEDTAYTDTNYLKSEILRPSAEGREYIKKLVIKYLTSKQ